MLQHALAIFRKEVRELTRDKRTMRGVFLMPAFVMLLMVSMFGAIANKMSKNPDITIGVVGHENNTLTSMLSTKGGAVVARFESAEDGLTALRNGKVRLLLEVPAGFDQSFAEGKANVQVHYDKQATMSMVALQTFNKSVEAMNQYAAGLSFQKNNLSPSLAQPLHTKETDENKATGLGASGLASLLPYLVVLFAFTSTLSAAADLIAGEKERGTMETLLIAPPSRLALAFGKWLALFVLSLVGGGVAIVALTLSGILHLPGTDDLFPSGATLPPLAVLQIIALILPLSAMYASMTMAVSAMARTMREAQSYLAVLNLLVIAPAVASQVVGVTGMDKSPLVRWIPVLSNAVGIKDALDNKSDWSLLYPSILCCLIIAAAFFAFGLSKFWNEKFLRRT